MKQSKYILIFFIIFISLLFSQLYSKEEIEQLLRAMSEQNRLEEQILRAGQEQQKVNKTITSQDSLKTNDSMKLFTGLYNGKDWTYRNPTQIQPADASRIIAIIRADIFEAFPALKEKYNSDLEKKAFKESSEYQSIITKLAQKKDTLLRSDFILTPPKQKRFISKQSLDIEEVGLTTYNVDKKAFYYPLGPEWSEEKFDELEGIFMYEIRADFSTPGIWFPSLQITTLSRSGKIQRYLKIPVPEEKALEIERNRNNVRLDILFRLQPYTKKIEFTWFGVSMDERFPVAKKVTIQLVDKITKDILYKKSYVDPE